MNDPGNVRLNASKPFTFPGKALWSGLLGVVGLLLLGCLAAPSLAQAPAQAAGSGAKAAQPSTQPKKVTATGPSKNGSGKMAMKTPKGMVSLPTRVVLVFATDAKGG